MPRLSRRAWSWAAAALTASVLLAGALLLHAPGTPPLLRVPLAEWRGAGGPVRKVPTAFGLVVEVPEDRALSCVVAAGENPFSGCSFTLSEATGRLAGADQPDPLRVSLIFERDRFEAERRTARPEPRQWPAGDLAGEVRQSLTGSTDGRAWALGCWRPLPERFTDCRLVIEGRIPGAQVAEFWGLGLDAVPPEPVALARVERLVRLLAAVEASFLPR